MVEPLASVRRSWRATVMTSALSLGLGCASTGLTATEQTLGSAAQIDPRYVEMADDGSWVMASQADRVDGPQVSGLGTVHQPPHFGFKLLLPGLDGIPVDSYRASPDGRTLLVEQQGRLRLFDVASSGWIDLTPSRFEEVEQGPEAGPLTLGEGTHLYNGNGRCFSDFSADGRMVLVLDGEPGAVRLVVRDLDQGHRVQLDPGAGVLDWARLLPSGDAVVVHMIVPGEPAAPQLDPWPWPLEDRPCVEPHTLAEGLTGVTRVLALDGRVLGERPGSYEPMGAGLVRPVEEGVFEWWRPDRDEVTTLPSCPGLILHADAGAGRMLMLCSPISVYDAGDDGLPGQLRLEMFDERVDLGEYRMIVEYPRVDHHQRTVAFRTVEGPVVVDLDERRTFRLPKGTTVVGMANGRALVRKYRLKFRPRPARVQLVDLRSGQALASFWERSTSWSSAWGRGAVMVFHRTVVDMEAGAVLGRLPGRASEVDRDGRVLVFEPSTQPRRGLPRGPLRWYSPSVDPGSMGDSSGEPGLTGATDSRWPGWSTGSRWPSRRRRAARARPAGG